MSKPDFAKLALVLVGPNSLVGETIREHSERLRLTTKALEMTYEKGRKAAEVELSIGDKYKLTIKLKDADESE